MLFPTVDFGIFFIIVFFGSWGLRDKPIPHKLFLLAASYFFYGYWNPPFALMLFGCSAGNYLFSLLIERVDSGRIARLGLQDQAPGRRGPLARFIFIIAVILNLSLIGFFKYLYFITTNVNSVFMLFGLPIAIPLIKDIILPVGVSFFTFQAMSYTIDVYRRELPASTAFLDVILYVAFFPQLVAGPILRAGDFLPQLKTRPVFNKIRYGKAFALIAFGLIKKVFIANYLGTMLVDKVFDNPTGFAGVELVLGVYAYAIQIFCDFSAYSEIAIGVAILLGYDFMDNFDNPYRATSLQDFWRRWHISLSTWLRDYLYIPLGGNRKGKIRTYINLLLTMLLGGLWHGADWKFIIWGGLHGTGLAVERAYSELKGKKKDSGRKKSFILKIIGVIFTFNFVCLGWIFFRAPSSEFAVQYISRIFAPFTGFAVVNPFLLGLIIIGIAIHFIPGAWGRRLHGFLDRMPIAAVAVGFSLFLVLLSAMSPEGVAPFIYFQF